MPHARQNPYDAPREAASVKRAPHLRRWRRVLRTGAIVLIFGVCVIFAAVPSLVSRASGSLTVLLVGLGAVVVGMLLAVFGGLVLIVQLLRVRPWDRGPRQDSASLGAAKSQDFR